MEKLQIEGHEFIPHINFDPSTGDLLIEGESCHEYTQEFFQPIFEWVDSFLQSNPSQIKLDFKMSYFNTASSKCFYEIIELLQEHHEEENTPVEVNWFYEEGDVDMLETGSDFTNDSGFPIKFIPVKQ